jgi:hypothetical protein
LPLQCPSNPLAFSSSSLLLIPLFVRQNSPPLALCLPDFIFILSSSMFPELRPNCLVSIALATRILFLLKSLVVSIVLTRYFNLLLISIRTKFTVLECCSHTHASPIGHFRSLLVCTTDLSLHSLKSLPFLHKVFNGINTNFAFATRLLYLRNLKTASPLFLTFDLLLNFVHLGPTSLHFVVINRNDLSRPPSSFVFFVLILHLSSLSLSLSFSLTIYFLACFVVFLLRFRKQVLLHFLATEHIHFRLLNITYVSDSIHPSLSTLFGSLLFVSPFFDWPLQSPSLFLFSSTLSVLCSAILLLMIISFKRLLFFVSHLFLS